VSSEQKKLGQVVNHLADHDKFLDKANEIAKKIASKSPQALRMTKRLIRNAQYATPDHAMQDAAAEMNDRGLAKWQGNKMNWASCKQRVRIQYVS
jgi:enoyl-CoA hydratase/carnithine racemase